jgi:hypothetical protein
MALHEEDNVLGLTEEPGSFYYWAIQQHVNHAANKLGCDRDTFEIVLHNYIDYQDSLEAANEDRDDYLKIAKGMFRYYLQAYRAQVAK